MADGERGDEGDVPQDQGAQAEEQAEQAEGPEAGQGEEPEAAEVVYVQDAAAGADVVDVPGREPEAVIRFAGELETPALREELRVSVKVSGGAAIYTLHQELSLHKGRVVDVIILTRPQAPPAKGEACADAQELPFEGGESETEAGPSEDALLACAVCGGIVDEGLVGDACALEGCEGKLAWSEPPAAAEGEPQGEEPGTGQEGDAEDSAEDAGEE